MSIRSSLLAVLMLLLLGLSIAYAQNLGGMGQNIGGGISREFDGGISSGHKVAGSPPPTCSNKLDFSVACNSQYISVLGIM